MHFSRVPDRMFVHCCGYHCSSGNCLWTDWNNHERFSDWQGREGLGVSGTVGFLLDLNEGTLSVFKNGRRLGVMKDGLVGEYSGFVTVVLSCTISLSKSLVPN